MRDIKFRVWYKDTNDLIEKATIQDIYDNENVSLDVNNLLFEQFTGLLDKNGTEIFEGDIVRYKTFVEFDSEKLIFIQGVIRWCERNLAWRIKGRCDNFLSYVIKDGMEVIGNIHENKLEDFV